jgi:hypothetical protein
VEHIVELKLSAEEDRALKRSAAAVRELVDAMFARLNIDERRSTVR